MSTNLTPTQHGKVSGMLCAIEHPTYTVDDARKWAGEAVKRHDYTGTNISAFKRGYVMGFNAYRKKQAVRMHGGMSR